MPLFPDSQFEALNPDFQFEDPSIMLLANNDPPFDPFGLNKNTSPGDANQLNPEPLSPLSPRPASQPQQQNDDGNNPPVAESTSGEFVCCKLKHGEQKQVCRKSK